MSTKSFNRMAAIVLIVSAAAVLVFNAVLIPGLMPAGWVYPGYLAISSMLVFALTAIYVYHLRGAGALLHLGYGLSAVSLFLTIGFNYYAVFAFPVLKAQFPEAVAPVLSGPMNRALVAAMIIGFVGNLALYIAILRAKTMPGWVVGLLIFGALLGVAMLPYNLGGIATGIALIGAGRAIHAGEAPALRAAEQPA